MRRLAGVLEMALAQDEAWCTPGGITQHQGTPALVRQFADWGTSSFDRNWDGLRMRRDVLMTKVSHDLVERVLIDIRHRRSACSGQHGIVSGSPRLAADVKARVAIFIPHRKTAV